MDADGEPKAMLAAQRELAFELDAYLLLANAQFVASQASAPIERATSRY